MSDHKEGLVDEYEQLTSRVEKLRDFIISGEFMQLQEIDRDDLREQLVHMQMYLSVLLRRVSRLAYCSTGNGR